MLLSSVKSGDDFMESSQLREVARSHVLIAADSTLTVAWSREVARNPHELPFGEHVEQSLPPACSLRWSLKEEGRALLGRKPLELHHIAIPGEHERIKHPEVVAIGSLGRVIGEAQQAHASASSASFSRPSWSSTGSAMSVSAKACTMAPSSS